ncbi:MAG: glycosyltransferase family 2 protein [Chitinophagaceae bacterium]|nr:glycosyltransferase family 2 protein [Chitinophagaceae bacterium]
MNPEYASARISVVMATYNGERFLQQQIDSILQQTLSPAELIIVDDCSNDGTLQILNDYAAKNPIVKIFSNEVNIGFVKNFEKGISLSTGNFIALSDQDDIWVADKLKTLFNGIGESLLIYSNSELVDEEGKSLHKKMSDIKNQIGFNSALMFVIGTWAPGHAFLFKRELAEKCIPFPSLVAHDFWLAFMATCYKPVKYLAAPLVLYRQHSSNTVSANTFAKSNKKHKPSRAEKEQRSRDRMQFLYETCPAERVEEKNVFKNICESYQNNSFRNRVLRFKTFFKYRDLILAYKNKSPLGRILFCVKMFFKIDS